MVPFGGRDSVSLELSSVSKLRDHVDSVRVDIEKKLEIKIIDYEITSATQQIVTGMKYVIDFTSSGRNYEVSIWVRPGITSSLLDALAIE